MSSVKKDIYIVPILQLLVLHTTVHTMHYNYINNGPFLGPSLAISSMIAWKKFWLANYLLTYFFCIEVILFREQNLSFADFFFARKCKFFIILLSTLLLLQAIKIKKMIVGY